MTDLVAYQGKRVTLTRNLAEPNGDGHSAIELEGTIELVAADGAALIIKERGHTMTTLIEAREIEPDSIKIVIERPRELKPRRLDLLTLSNARNHLLDRHSWGLTAVNEMTDEQAMTAHEGIAHKNLGHFHVTRNADSAKTDEEESSDAS